MKKFILATLAAATAITGTAAPALANPFHGDNGRFEQRFNQRSFDGHDGGRWQNRSWRMGDRFDSRYAYNYRLISNPGFYRLHDAPHGYRWVQSGNDAVLVGLTSGIIAAVMANALIR